MEKSLKFVLLLILIILGAGYNGAFYLALDGYLPSSFPSFVLAGAIFGLLSFLVTGLVYRQGGSQKSSSDRGSKPKTDKVTGLLHRSVLDGDIRALKNPLYSLIIADMDDFKKIDPQAVEGILLKAGKIAVSSVRVNDRVYRYGEDEFAVLLDHCNKDKAIEIAENIRQRVSQQDNSPFPKVTISAAVLSYPEDGDNPYDLFEGAKGLLLSAKKSGKNCTFAMSRGRVSESSK